MTSKSKKITIITGAVILVLGGSWAANKYVIGGPEKSTVQVDLAKLDDLSETVSASGRIQPQTKVDITSQVSGEIVALHVAEGDVVSKGALLVELDRVQLGSDKAQAQYSLDEIEARADGARVLRDKNKEEYERQIKLYEKKLTSETVYTNSKYDAENSEASLRAMLSQVKTQRARLDKAKDNLARATITAPMDGVITYLSVEVGEIAQAQTSFTQGKTLMTISDLSVFEVDVEVDETEIAKIDLGQSAEIEVDAYPDSVFSGTVVEIGNSAVESGAGTQEFSINFRVKVRFDPTSAKIRPGMSASVDVTTATSSDVVTVPYASIVMRYPSDTIDNSDDNSAEDSGGIIGTANAAEGSDVSNEIEEDEDEEKLTGVFVVRDGKAHFVIIETGIADEKDIVALSGVQKGDTVISGSFKTLRELQSGDLVEIDEESLSGDKKKRSGKRGGRK